MRKRLFYSVPAYGRENLLAVINILKREWCKMHDDTRYCKLYMNKITYNELIKQIREYVPTPNCNTYTGYTGKYGTVFGLDIDIDDKMDPFIFTIKEDKEMNIPKLASGGIITVKKLPEKYIINKGATVLFWDDGTKTVVKRAENDEYNKIMGFLWAYFQKTSGLSRTKANKYLRGLVDADDLKTIKLNSAFKDIFKPKK